MLRKIQRTLGSTLPVLLLIAYAFIAVCHLNRWDSMAAVTLVPIWAWAGIGMVVSILFWVVSRGIFPIIVFCVCLVTGVAFSEETLTIFREFKLTLSGESSAPAKQKHYRIVNVNCAASESAFGEAVDTKPDLLIVQEAPGEEVLEAAAKTLFGDESSVTIHLNNAILARGELLGVLTDPESATMHIRLKPPDGIILDITNLDLTGSAPRLDMWHPSVWIELKEARTRNRRLVRSALGENEITRSDIGRIICGGFGTPPGDDVFRPLEANGLIDTFAAVGTGWGNTRPSDYPVLRLDQIWVSANLKPLKSETRLNPSAPSRIVVSEVRLPGA